MRLAAGQRRSFTLVPSECPLQLGDEVSVGIERSRPSRVLAIMSHTSGEGANLLRRAGDKAWPGNGDRWILATAGASFVAFLPEFVGPSFMAFGILYWIFAQWIPARRRGASASRLDFIMDTEYFRWRASARLR